MTDIQAVALVLEKECSCCKLAAGDTTVGITTYLKNKGLLEHAQTLANHSSPRTTKLYDRRTDDISLDEVEKIAI